MGLVLRSRKEVGLVSLEGVVDDVGPRWGRRGRVESKKKVLGCKSKKKGSPARQQGGSTTGRAIDDMSELRVTRDLGHGAAQVTGGRCGFCGRVDSACVQRRFSFLGPTHPFASLSHAVVNECQCDFLLRAMAA